MGGYQEGRGRVVGAKGVTGHMCGVKDDNQSLGGENNVVYI